MGGLSVSSREASTFTPAEALVAPEQVIVLAGEKGREARVGVIYRLPRS